MDIKRKTSIDSRRRSSVASTASSRRSSLAERRKSLSEGRRKSLAKTLEKQKDKVEKITIRRAKRSDIAKVEMLITPKTKAFFGDCNVGDTICKSYMSAVMEDDKKVIACLCVNNFPNVPSIPPWYWNTWIVNLYKLNYITPRNSLWVHFACHDANYATIFLQKMLVYVYQKCYFVDYILFVVPPGIKHVEWLDNNGIVVSPQGYPNPAKLQSIFLTTRFDFVLTYKTRRAVEQDNDDVVDLISKYSMRLKRLYGEYYIAELIMESQYEDRHVIVAEYGGAPVAVMILNNVLNYEVINQAFKLETFYGLKKPDPRDDPKSMDLEERNEGQDSSPFDITSFASVPERVAYSEGAVNESEDIVSQISSESTISTDLDFELATDVETDLHYILSEKFVQPPDNSEEFFGTLEDQVGCVILSYTDEEYDKWTKKKNFHGHLSQSRVFHPKVPIYYGEDNAFVIEVAAAHPDHESALRYLLEASYECFKDKDYCVLCLPSTDFTFSLLKLFSRVTPRPSSNFANELYVAHRCSILSDVNIREATHYDYDVVKHLLEKHKNFEEVFDEFLTSVSFVNSKYNSYIFTSGLHVVGLAILSEQDNIEYINSHYQLLTWTDMTRHKVGAHGSINYFILSPIFYIHARYFLQELHRLSDYSILYYRITPEDIQGYQVKQLACILGYLLPVVPANLSETEVMGNEYWRLPDVLAVCEQPFALYISTPLHCGLSRCEVNTKIVVVGASDVALAFLVELIFKNNPYYRVTFNNITLVSPHGICRQRINRIREILIPSRSILHGRYLSLLSLRTYVNIVTGVMSAINRKEKTITVNSTFLPYDLLFITCGRQYQMPQRNKKLRGNHSEYPHNVFIVNTDIDADIAITKLNSIISGSGQLHYTVIVYGHNLETFSCLAALLEFGIPSMNLVLVDPVPEGEEAYIHSVIFDDADVEDAVMNEIKQLGVEIFSGYHFIDWKFDTENNGVTSVVFESKHMLQEIECIGMFAYCDKMVSARTYLAINRAGLVFDGGLVIGPDCQTNDPNIYAAGSITKYPRRYYADHRNHQYYNQEEIGRRLAEHISEKLVTTYTSVKEDTIFTRCNASQKMLVPQYKHPLVEYAVLPGNLYYLNVKKPGVSAPQDVAMTAEDYGQVLLSGSCKSLERQGYFRLHLNPGNIVETITCLAKFQIQRVNLTCIWGKHERLLNNLIQRFEMVLIPDLFEFFKEEWTYMIYNDNYKKLNADMNEILMSFADEPGRSLIEDICNRYKCNDWKALTAAQNKELKANFLNSDYKTILTEQLLNFCADHMLYLPMYAHPLIVSIVLGGYEESPFFKKI